MRPSASHHLATAASLVALCATAHLSLPDTVRAASPSPVQVQVGYPSVWSLEQAHYLLERVRSENQNLKSKLPDENALDPNATHGSRIEILRSVFGAQLALDETAGATNRLLLEDHRANVEHRAELQQLLGERRRQLAENNRSLTLLAADLAALEDDEPARQPLEAQRAALTAENSFLQSDFDLAKGELEALDASPPGKDDLVSAAASGDEPDEDLLPSPLSKGLIDKVVAAGTQPGLGAPQLHASNVLDNYVQMQYELIAKQLTLLRDELGSERRLVFLELPADFYTPRGNRAKKHLARVEWRVTGVCRLPQALRDRIAERFNGQLPPVDFDAMQELCKRRPATILQALDRLFPLRVEDLEQLCRSGNGSFGWVCSQSSSRLGSIVQAVNGVGAKTFWARLAGEAATVMEARRAAEEAAEKAWAAAEEAREAASAADVHRRAAERAEEAAAVSQAPEESATRVEEATRAAREAEAIANEREAEAESARRVAEKAADAAEVSPARQLQRLVCDNAAQKVVRRLIAEYLPGDEQKAAETDVDSFCHQLSAMEFSPHPDSERLALVERSLWTPTAPADPSRHAVRVVDLVPRQSALNVSEIHNTVKGWRFTGKLIQLLGFGGRADYQRQRENFEQFMHQDVFASGYGKGATEFGWTFGPKPGSKRIAPGVQTTFAVLVLPRDAAAIKLEADAFGYPSKRDPAAWNPGTQAWFTVEIPGVAEGFYVTEASYTPVPAGDRVVVDLRGDYFSPQVGVLVNGVPLTRVIGIARPDLDRRQPAAGRTVSSDTIAGEFELVNSRLLTLSFAMGSSYAGTPIISLVTPEKATAINYYYLNSINGSSRGASLEERSRVEPMFMPRLAIGQARIVGRYRGPCGGTLTADPAGGILRLAIEGTGLRPGAEVLLNGRALSCGGAPVRPFQRSTERYELDFDAIAMGAPTWEILLRQRSRQGVESASVSMRNLLAPSVAGQEVLRFTEGKGGEITAILTIAGFAAADQLQVARLGGGRVAPCASSPVAQNGVTCRVLSRTQLLVGVDRPDAPQLLEIRWPAGALTSVLTVQPPLEPRVTKLSKATGAVAGLEPLTIAGAHLAAVKRVYFGTARATVLKRTAGQLDVLTPPGAAGTVAVRLETDVRFQGSLVSNDRDLATADGLRNSTYKYVAPAAKK